MKCGVRSAECGVRSVECEVRSRQRCCAQTKAAPQEHDVTHFSYTLMVQIPGTSCRGRCAPGEHSRQRSSWVPQPQHSRGNKHSAKLAILPAIVTDLMTQKPITIAIDGWSSCGKSTLAKQLAKELNYVYVDSGAMYRAITLYFLRNHVDWTKKKGR